VRFGCDPTSKNSELEEAADTTPTACGRSSFEASCNNKENVADDIDVYETIVSRRK